MYILSIISIIVISIFMFLMVKTVQVRQGKINAQREFEKLHYSRMSPFSLVKRLSILPLIDFYTEREDIKTEAGVSYLIKADETTILMDIGFNPKGFTLHHCCKTCVHWT